MEQSHVEDLRNRRPEALQALLDRYGREIQGVAYLILRDRSDAEEVAMETLLTAWQRVHELRDPAAVRSWLLRIATNKSLSHRRRSARVAALHVVVDNTAAPDHAAESVDRLTLLTSIAELPPQMRAALVLRYYADLSVDEVASALGKSPNTIKAQLQAALDRLRASLLDQPPAARQVRHG